MSLRRALSWHRRKIGALAAAVSVVAIITTVSPAPPATADVVATATALAPGHQLTAADLRVVAVPLGLVPDEAITDPDEAVGRTVTGALTRGQLLTAPALVRPSLRPDGLVTSPVRLADAQVVALLQVGDQIDVLAADPRTGASTVVAKDARISAIPAADPGGMLGGDSSSQLVLVEVTAEVAAALAAAAVNGPLSVVWH